QRKDQHNHAQTKNEIGVGELKPAPGNVVTSGFQPDQQQGKPNEPRENSRGERQAISENLLTALSRLLNEAEDLERNYRQHARHQIQNESAEKTEEQKRCNSASGLAGLRGS